MKSGPKDDQAQHSNLFHDFFLLTKIIHGHCTLYERVKEKAETSLSSSESLSADNKGEGNYSPRRNREGVGGCVYNEIWEADT